MYCELTPTFKVVYSQTPAEYMNTYPERLREGLTCKYESSRHFESAYCYPIFLVCSLRNCTATRDTIVVSQHIIYMLSPV